MCIVLPFLIFFGSQAAFARPGDGNEPDDMFPGVRGVSGEELKRRLAEYERRQEEIEKRRQAQQPQTQSQPQQKPGDETGPTQTDRQQSALPEKPADSAAPRRTPATADNPNLTETPPGLPDPRPTAGDKKNNQRQPDQPTKVAEPADGLDKLSQERQDYLLGLQQQVEFIEEVMAKAEKIRKEGEVTAAEAGYEPRIQYYLRYQRAAAPQTRAYAQAIGAPLFIYRYVVGQSRSVSLAARPENRPKDLPASMCRQVEALQQRAEQAGREALVRAAAIYTRIRQLPAAAKIYKYLLERYPEDDEIKKAYAAFVAVWQEPKPTAPPMQSVPKAADDKLKEMEEEDGVRRRR